MRIKKTFQGSLPENKILNTQSDSQTDTYSCDYLNPSLAQMHCGAKQDIDVSELQLVTVWGNDNIEIGEFYCDPDNSRIIIPKGSAEYIEVYGNICGHGNCIGYLDLYDENDTAVCYTNFLHQHTGNGYEIYPIAPMIMKITDTSKDHYLKMNLNGYNSESFSLNNGFNNRFTYMGVRKIK